MTSLVNFLKDASLGNFYRGGTVPVVPTTASNKVFPYHRPLVTDVRNGIVDILELYDPKNIQAYMNNNLFVNMTPKLKTMLTSYPTRDDNPQLYVIGEVCANELKGDKLDKDMSNETIASFLKGPQANNSAVFRYILPITKKPIQTIIQRVNLSYAILKKSNYVTIPWKFICYGVSNGDVKIMDAESKEIYSTIQYAIPNCEVTCITVLLKTQRICVGIASRQNNNTNHLCLYDMIYGTLVATSNNVTMSNTTFPVERNKAIRSVVFIDSLNIVVSGDDNGNVIIWDSKTLVEKKKIELNNQSSTNYVQVASVVYYTDQTNVFIFAGCWVTTKAAVKMGALYRIKFPIDFINPANFEDVIFLEQVTSLAIGQNNLYVATNGTDEDETGKVYRCSNFRENWTKTIQTFYTINDDINTIALAKGETRLAVGTNTKGIKIRLTTDLRPLSANIIQNEPTVSGLIFDNDDKVIYVDHDGLHKDNQQLDNAQNEIFTCVTFMEIKHSEKMKRYFSDSLPSFDEYDIDYDQITNKLQKEVLQRKIGLTVSIKTIGVTCGNLFSFPAWIDKRLLNDFIDAYNNGKKDNNIITRYIDEKPSIRVLKTWLKTHYTHWESKWINIIADKRRDINQWSNTFDIALLSDHKYSSLSVFVLYGKQTHAQIDTDDDYSDSKDDVNETTIYASTDFLLPVPLLTRRTRGTISWNSVSKYFTPDLTKKQKKHMSYWLTKTKEQDGLINTYMILLAANGGQGIEHVNLSSVLGSGAHTAAALDTLTKHMHLVAGFSTSLENIALLTKYEKDLPKIVDVLGKLLAKTTIDGHVNEPHESMIAVEFPVYYLKRKIDTMYIYSRIDAISENFFDDQEGYAIWEYKTRWGGGIITNETGADEMHVRQTAFYCFCVNNMLLSNNKVNFFYIRYIKMINETSFENTLMEVHTFRYRYAQDPSNTELWNAEKHYNFQTKINNIPQPS